MQNTYMIGERVAINLNMDRYKTTDKVLFGKVIQCILDDRKHYGIFMSPVLTIVQGDDDEIYQGLSFSRSNRTKDVFMSKAEFVDGINMRRSELREESRILKDFENLYMKELTNRQANGGDESVITERYKNIKYDMADRIMEEYAALTYLWETYLELFYHRPINGIVYEEKAESENDESGENGEDEK